MPVEVVGGPVYRQAFRPWNAAFAACRHTSASGDGKCTAVSFHLDVENSSMTRHETNFTNASPFKSLVSVRRHPLDEQASHKLSTRVVAYTPGFEEVARLFERASNDLGTETNLGVIRRIMSNNPASVLAFARREGFDCAAPHAEGIIAWLPLTAAGHAALLNGTFNVQDPDPFHLTAQHEPSTAIYVWAIYAPGLAGGVGIAFDQMSSPLHRHADLYARAASISGRRLITTLGFEPLDTIQPTAPSGLYVFRKPGSPLGRPLYDSYPTPGQHYTFTVVRTHDDLAKVMAIRSAVYIGEQACPFEEEFDGNDFSSTHLIGYAGDEPAASLRVRCFATFAKVERLAVRQEYRRSRLAPLIVKAAHELCRMKGYARVYGHAQKGLVNFWRRAGARPFPGAREFAFSDYDYVEMLAEIEPHPNAIAVGADPYVIIRPEGRWHTTGVLERSGDRSAKRPKESR
ncbi:GNAT family N-acetyltransferase [Methylorubrum populi]|uniref:GNAT family N-acetyltransferase n=1 Tax=Methylorubrum populi TaxID=223967 RepID=UPI003F65CA5C